MAGVQSHEDRVRAAMEAAIPHLEAQQRDLDEKAQTLRVQLAELQSARMGVQIRLTTLREALDTWEQTEPTPAEADVARTAPPCTDQVAPAARAVPRGVVQPLALDKPEVERR